MLTNLQGIYTHTHDSCLTVCANVRDAELIGHESVQYGRLPNGAVATYQYFKEMVVLVVVTQLRAVHWHVGARFGMRSRARFSKSGPPLHLVAPLRSDVGTPTCGLIYDKWKERRIDGKS